MVAVVMVAVLAVIAMVSGGVGITRKLYLIFDS